MRFRADTKKCTKMRKITKRAKLYVTQKFVLIRFLNDILSFPESRTKSFSRIPKQYFPFSNSGTEKRPIPEFPNPLRNAGGGAPQKSTKKYIVRKIGEILLNKIPSKKVLLAKINSREN